MHIKKLKQADKIHDNIRGNLFTIKALLTILEERNKENYPENYLFSIALRTEKTAMRRVNKSSILLMEMCIRDRYMSLVTGYTTVPRNHI